MSKELHNLTLDILKQIQTGFAEMRDRFDKLENINRKQRRDSAGMLVMMRATAGNFEERVTDVEERMAALEKAGLRS